MSANVNTYIADALHALLVPDGTLECVKVFTENHTNTKPQVYASCLGVSYPDRNEKGGSTGLGVARCGITANQYMSLDAAKSGAAAQAVGEVISKIQWRLWDVDCDLIAAHTDARFAARIHAIIYKDGDGHFDKGEQMVRAGILVDVLVSVRKILVS